MDTAYTVTEFIAAIIGLGLTGAFAAWASVIKKMSDDMGARVERISGELRHSVDMMTQELGHLRMEIHKDRLINERRFARIEATVSVYEHRHVIDDEDDEDEIL